jgi:hypothetical protein
VNGVTCLKIGNLNRRHLLLGYKDGRVLIVDVDNPKTRILEYKFDGGKIESICFTSALRGILTAVMDDGCVWVLAVHLDDSKTGSYCVPKNGKPVKFRGGQKELKHPKLLKGSEALFMSI